MISERQAVPESGKAISNRQGPRSVTWLVAAFVLFAASTLVAVLQPPPERTGSVTLVGRSFWRPIERNRFLRLLGINAAILSVYFADAQRGWAVGEQGTVLVSTDGGFSWHRQISGTQGYLLSVYFADAQRGWIVGYPGTILATTDGGSSWHPQISGTQEYLLSVYFADGQRGWTAGNQGTILATTDGGSSWHLQTSATELRSLYFSDTQRGWAVGRQGILTSMGNMEFRDIHAFLHIAYETR
jgi:photosystem II stability/assembly factor-like uncharacterized protein